MITRFRVLRGGLEFVETVQGHDVPDTNTTLPPVSVHAVTWFHQAACTLPLGRGMLSHWSHTARHSHPTAGDTTQPVTCLARTSSAPC